MLGIEDLVTWKHYVRNRLLELIRRAGSDNIFREIKYGSETVSPAQLLSRLDRTHRSFMNSIEKYGFQRSEEEQVFRKDAGKAVPVDEGPEAFIDALHGNFEQMIAFIREIDPDDLTRPIEHPLIKAPLTMGWILQYTTFHEMAVASEIQTILNFEGASINVPWATTRFMRPPRKIPFK